MDLIDREELLKRFELTSQANGNAIRYEIKCAPTVDAQPVLHGKWERTDITEENGWALYRCSCCDWHTTYYYSFSASPTYNFCPNCGAKMIDRWE